MKYGSSYDGSDKNTLHHSTDRSRSGGENSSKRLVTYGILRDSSQQKRTSGTSSAASSHHSTRPKGNPKGNSQRNSQGNSQTTRTASGTRKRNRSSVSYRSSQPASYRQVSRAEDRPRKKKQPARHKKGHGCLTPFLLLIAIVIVGFLAIRLSLNSAFAKIEKYALNTDDITVNEMDANIKDYQNIALFGVDNQDNKISDKGSRTDCIIIASIHKSTKKVKLMSIYRDTYVSIDGEYDKINAAYSYGGPEMALRTINRNLDLNITDFATINFKALADAVDVLGGISLTITSEKELDNLNDYIGNMNKINGGNSPKFSSTGTYTFDGNQAVAYSRIRYMAGGDHARANHQRLVLEGIMKAAKKKPWKLGKLISTVLPQCKTSLSNNQMTKMTLSLLRYQIADSQAYPFDSQDEKYNGIYYGFPLTAVSNVKKAHKYLFGTKDYVPTDELQKISGKIQVITDYLGL